ncbi:AAA family ATPase [Rivibacter subsaxonicus]|uniref:Transcriptional regulator n=1 Tax=Rivibacter subsaxonicus TaxID=457575 RepID=A0A4Q7VN66_9BURK|nr:AAA family ATPase [Rivibacter subsaxonicus]RZT97790.1 transcriptional regulator [Rivibacter subsaxonicus]
MARSQSTPNPVRVRFDEFDLDEANACLLCNGKAVALAPTPFNLLCELARQPGTLLTKDALLDAVWGHQFVSESVLKTAISDLRTVLVDNPREPRFIETVSRRGYRFIAVPASAPAAPPVATTVAAAGPQPSPSFIGRADAIARLQQAWDQACSGKRAVVWVAGEPGIGKTTLIEHFVASLGGIACARGQCVEHYGPGEPYLPVLEALAELCRGDRTLPALLRSVAPTWLLQLPWLSTAEERDVLRRELTGVGPDRMLREMGELLDRYTEQRPLLLVTEDLHWSDRATLQLIDYVARRRPPARLMWLSSFRLAEVIALDHPLTPLRHELRLQRLCQEVVLDPFSEIEVADCVAQHSATLARDEAFVRALHERTDGVPLFVSSVITEVMERAADEATAEGRLAAMAVPENLAAIIDHYIARLDNESRALLAAAAVCGVEFRVDTVALALEREVASVADACEMLVREQVWLSSPRAGEGNEAREPPYGFRHALFRQVLYDRTAPSARAHLHRKVGAALERERSAGVPVTAAVLAMHFDRARQPITALRYYADAAEAALLHFSPASALGLTERASALLQQAPEGEERDALEIAIATFHGVSAFQSLGVGIEARDAFERAYVLLQRRPGHAMRGRLLHGFGYVLSLRGEYAQALAVAQHAEARSSGSNDPALMLAACIVNGEVHQLQGRPQAALAWIERGLITAEPLDLAAGEIFVADPQVTLLGMLVIELVHRGLIEQARAHLQRSHERARALRQPMTQLVATWHEALFEVRLGNAERVAALAEEMQALVDEFSLAQGRMACRWYRGWAQAWNGAPLEGYGQIHEACEENARLGMRSGTSEVLGYAAQALLLAGDSDAAQVQLQEARQAADELAERVYLPQLWLLEAAIARAQGRADAGAASVRRAIDEARAQQAPWLELLALVDLCEHHDAADAERSALAHLVGRLPEAGDTTPVRRARSILQPAKPA